MVSKVSLKDYEDLLKTNTGKTAQTAQTLQAAKKPALPVDGNGTGGAGRAPATTAGTGTQDAGASSSTMYDYLRQLAEANRNAAVSDAQSRYDALGKASEAAVSDAERYASETREGLDAERVKAMRDASIMYDRMAKYLPQLQAAQGIAGSGLANEQAVGVYNDILNRQAGAQAAYDAGVRESERSLDAYRREVGLQQAQAEADRQSAVTAADTAYNDQLAQYRIAEEQDKQTKAQDTTALQSAEETLNAMWARAAGTDGLMSVEDYAQWAKQADSVRGQLPAEQQALFDNYVAAQKSYVRSDEEQQRFTSTTRPAAAYNGGLNNTNLGNNFTIMAGEEKVKVELGPRVTLADNYSQAYGDGDVFEHNGRIYINYAGGTYEVRARSDSARRQHDLQTLKNYLREQAEQ